MMGLGTSNLVMGLCTVLGVMAVDRRGAVMRACDWIGLKTREESAGTPLILDDRRGGGIRWGFALHHWDRKKTLELTFLASPCITVSSWILIWVASIVL